MKEIKIIAPADFNFVPGIRTCVAHIAYNFGFSEKESYQIQTVVDEICNNAVEHGSNNRQRRVELSCKFKKGYMELIVKDGDGKDFNLKEVFKRNLESLKKNPFSRGRGLLIVQKLVNKLDIRVDKKGTAVKIIKEAVKNRRNI